jgi:hypothetical protein
MSERIITLETLPEAEMAFKMAPVSIWAWVAWLCLREGKPAPQRIWVCVGTVWARINHGRWIADCPHCSGALVVSRTDPYFWCPACRMAQSGWQAVKFPGEADEIEAVLMKRPDKRTRNWYPGETVEALERENAEHGIGPHPWKPSPPTPLPKERGEGAN